MSGDTQPPATSQQQQQQQQVQQQQQKQCKDNASPANNTTTPTRKTNIHEMRNQDFVSRLMAATPPYLYSAPVGANNFYFSDMLRSLVAARNNENARNLQLQQSLLTRRARKRSWSQQRPYYEQLRERKEAETKLQLPSGSSSVIGAPGAVEKPLELTHKPLFQLSQKYRKLDEHAQLKGEECKTISVVNTKNGGNSYQPNANNNNSGNLSSATGGGAVDSVLQDTPPAASLPPQDLVLPPPPPMWYPSLYPPYGIDPLHFFIDLRVSGHIYDRKKENVSPLTSAENSSGSVGTGGSASGNSNNPDGDGNIPLPNKHRHGSAFTVPVPRSNELKTSAGLSDAINLTAANNYTKYYDLGESKENQPLSKSSANYMLQHLPRLYSQFAARDLLASNMSAAVAAAEQQAAAAAAAAAASGEHFDVDNKSEPDCDGDSDGRASIENDGDNRVGDIDVEVIDSIKYRTDGESSSRCSSADEASITQID